MKKVQILMSTYNGEKYIKEQIDSILEQDYPYISMLIRDDGSDDSTIKILEDYSKRYPRIQYYQGKNIGCWQSFMDLIQNSSQDTDYFAFCDQDDVWLKDKISSAVKILGQHNQKVPLLYCSKLQPVGENLEKIKVTINNINFRPSFGNAIIQNICTGCTGVINRVAVDMALNKIPRYMVQHDWWFYLIASCYGEVVYDEESHILYRQHGNNEVGARTTQIEQLKYRLRTYGKRRGNIYRQLIEFNQLFRVDGENQHLLDLVLDTKYNVKKRIEMILNKKIYRQKITDDLIYKVIILIGDA
jgi:glycosyltransferase involved in cell wall biosynthesis